MTTPATQPEFSFFADFDLENVLQQTSLMTGPGAGLRSLDTANAMGFDSDMIFENVFGFAERDALQHQPPINFEMSTATESSPLVRTYQSSEDL